MVATLAFISGNSFFNVKQTDEHWVLEEHSFDWKFMSIASDPFIQDRMYAGTFDHGLLVSEDAGKTWSPVGAGIKHDRVMSVAVSPIKQGEYGVVWAGTEPSDLYKSEDGGETWLHCPGIVDVPSVDTWFFPPRPHTHHVHAIQPDLHEADRIFVGIELGGVLKSTDSGQTWEDRKAGSQYDCHGLTMHEQAKGRLYEAAGGGFAETLDGGKTWETKNEGLGDYTYLVNVAVDTGDPDLILASAAKGAKFAYRSDQAETIVIRKENDGPWERVDEGLPKKEGSTVFALQADPLRAGSFFAVNNRGIYESSNRGKSWTRLNIDWKESYQTMRVRELLVL